jgi:hypothetical protein
VIWAGALIEGKEAHNFVYTPFVVNRRPITLLASLEETNNRVDMDHFRIRSLAYNCKTESEASSILW